MIHVLIERHIAEDMLSTYETHSRAALQRSYVVPGFISGESFANVDNPNRRYLLCKWRTRHDWNTWYYSEERKEVMNTIRPILNQPEKVTLLDNEM